MFIYYCIITLFSFLLLLGHQECMATTGKGVEFNCPVCKNVCYGAEVYSSNSFGGFDMDLLQRASGAFPFLIAPITCEKCLFSGVKDSFTSEVSEAVKSKLLKEKSVKLSDGIDRKLNRKLRNWLTEGLENEKITIPAWGRFLLMAEIFPEKFDDFNRLLNLHLSICWAIRLEENPFMESFLELGHGVQFEVRQIHKDKYRPLVKDRKVNRAPIEVKILTEHLSKLKSLEERLRFPMLLFSLGQLRSHGENQLIKRNITLLEKYMKPADSQKLVKAYHKAAKLEEKYQKRLISELKLVLNDESREWQGKNEKLLVNYLYGELSRRTNDLATAKKVFARVVKNTEVPPWIIDHCKAVLEK